VDEFNENIKEYKTIIKVGVKLCDDILLKLKQKSSNSESHVTVFAGFDNASKLLISLLELVIPHKNGIFCTSSLLALSRTVIELTNTIYFFFLDETDKQESQLRLNLFNYISKKDRFEIAKKMNAPIEFYKINGLTKNEIEKSKELIETSPFYNKLIENESIISFSCLVNDSDRKNKYFNRYQILKSRNIRTDLVDWYYKMSSTFLHGSPASIDRARQTYINKEYLNYDYDKEVLSIMQVVTSFYSLTLLNVSDYFQFDESYLNKSDRELLINYGNVITNNR
jgi:hypothetical protein